MKRLACVALQVVVCFSMLNLSMKAQENRPGSQRPFRIEDLFHLENMGQIFGGPYAFSVDGTRTAFVRTRDANSIANHEWDYLDTNVGGDVWVQLAPGTPPVNVTHGAADGSGWWAPQWSKDGRFLAMLSTRGAKVRLWLWDVETKRIQRITERAVDLSGRPEDRPFEWVDAAHVVCPLLPADKQPLAMTVDIDTPAVASAEWPKAETGKETTANVLDSGLPSQAVQNNLGDMMLIDVRNGTSKVIIQGSPEYWKVSPAGDAVVVSQKLFVHAPDPDLPLRTDPPDPQSVEIVAMDGARLALAGNKFQDVVVSSVRWSPDGKQLAFLGHGPGENSPLSLFRVNIADRTVSGQPLKSMEVDRTNRRVPSQLEWSGKGDLLFRASNADPGTDKSANNRQEWWLVTRTGEMRCLSQTIENSPSVLWAEPEREKFFGLSAGRIWQLNLDDASWTALTPAEQQVKIVSWPARWQAYTSEVRPLGETYRRAIFGVGEGRLASFFVLNLDSRQIDQIRKPALNAEIAAYEPNTDTAVFFSNSRDGLFVWSGSAHSDKWDVLVKANIFLAGVEEARSEQIEYISLEGKKLKGWLIYPIGYQKGRRYPLVTLVYPGSMASATLSNYYGINSSGSLSPQVFAAHGYAVLMPSMPVAAREGVADDVMLGLTNGVLPAVDKVIDMGVADPGRVFVMGHSNGGFGTYGLVTQTNRFRAAVSLAGMSDFVSLYGQFDARMRYGNDPQQHLSQQLLTETGEGMGGPPWKDLGRYLRNSPIFYVHRVTTPIMIVQGDLDYVAIQQGEEFFNSLYRQSKRARFVRYWGESHVLQSPANIRDCLYRILAWFDDFGDISRNAQGDLVWDKDTVKSRHGAPALEPAEFAKFDQ